MGWILSYAILRAGLLYLRLWCGCLPYQRYVSRGLVEKGARKAYVIKTDKTSKNFNMSPRWYSILQFQMKSYLSSVLSLARHCRARRNRPNDGIWKTRKANSDQSKQRSDSYNYRKLSNVDSLLLSGTLSGVSRTCAI